MDPILVDFERFLNTWAPRFNLDGGEQGLAVDWNVEGMALDTEDFLEVTAQVDASGHIIQYREKFRRYDVARDPMSCGRKVAGNMSLFIIARLLKGW